MCGRFSLGVNLDDLVEAFPDFTFPPETEPRYNIAPTQNVMVVPNNTDGHVSFFRWGLIPSWAKDMDIGNRLINARGETLAEKPSFRAAYLRRRCLILADGFYEWQTIPGSKAKQPIYIQLATKKRLPLRIVGTGGPTTAYLPAPSSPPNRTPCSTDPYPCRHSAAGRLRLVARSRRAETRRAQPPARALSRRLDDRLSCLPPRQQPGDRHTCLHRSK